MMRRAPPPIVWLIAFLGLTMAAEGLGGWSNLFVFIVGGVAVTAIIRLILMKPKVPVHHTSRSPITSRASPATAPAAAKNGFAAMESDTRLISNRADLARCIADEGGGPHYVYVLRDADGTPFYVGIGVGARLFAHEDEARDPKRSSAKVEKIRSIWAAGAEVQRTIDSVHKVEPWDREEELINTIGRREEGKGPLLNAQVYAASKKMQGIELRKYAALHEASGDPNEIPAKFKLREARLKAGPVVPGSRSSVFGKIYAVAEANPGVTGEELLRLLQRVDFRGNKSAYTQSGQVSASWLVGYIEGAYYRSDRLHLQPFKPST